MHIASVQTWPTNHLRGYFVRWVGLCCRPEQPHSHAPARPFPTLPWPPPSSALCVLTRTVAPRLCAHPAILSAATASVRTPRPSSPHTSTRLCALGPCASMRSRAVRWLVCWDRQRARHARSLLAKQPTRACATAPSAASLWSAPKARLESHAVHVVQASVSSTVRRFFNLNCG